MQTTRRAAVAVLLEVAAVLRLPFRAGADPIVPADRARTASVFTFYLENDFSGGTDRHYTNGVKLSWLSRDLTTSTSPGRRRMRRSMIAIRGST
jgi:hypothetical protein